jgi:hypothetical protein
MIYGSDKPDIPRLLVLLGGTFVGEIFVNKHGAPTVKGYPIISCHLKEDENQYKEMFQKNLTYYPMNGTIHLLKDM